VRRRTGLSWDDLRLVLAIGQAGTLSGGARTLGIDHSTAFRRLGALEARLGVRLFDRARDGYAATPAGEAIIGAAGRFDEVVAGLERHLAGEDLRPSGIVRVTTADTLFDLLAPHLARFRAGHPEIVLELVVANAFLSLTKRDADIAIRPAVEAPEALAGRRVATVATALYAARSAHRAKPASLVDANWIGFDENLRDVRAARWIEAHIPAERIVVRVNSVLAMRTLAREGIGIAALPCYLADPDPGLARLHPPLDEMASALWLLTHPDLRRVARIRAFLDFMAETLAPLRRTFEGRLGR
jgi:DNA-binding transcriptional LysR family regulator